MKFRFVVQRMRNPPGEVHMIQQFPSHAVDDTLSLPVLPWAPERSSLWVDRKALDRARDCGGEDRVVVVDQESMRRAKAE
jgi:hypothetical protein